MPITTTIEQAGLVDASLLPFHFVTGNMMVFHRNAIYLLLLKLNELARTIIDDLSLSLFFKKAGLLPCQIGRQYFGFAERYNLDCIVSFRNQSSETRVGDMRAMEMQVQALNKRYFSIPGTIVKHVYYHNKDITSRILQLCKENDGKWTVRAENKDLDITFGDPAPGVLKRLHLMDNEKDLANFVAEWTFALEGECLKIY